MIKNTAATLSFIISINISCTYFCNNEKGGGYITEFCLPPLCGRGKCKPVLLLRNITVNQYIGRYFQQ